MPGMKFTTNKVYVGLNEYLFFDDYFADIKKIRKKKLDKLNKLA